VSPQPFFGGRDRAGDAHSDKPEGSLMPVPPIETGNAAPVQEVTKPLPPKTSTESDAEYAARLRVAPDYLEYVRSLLTAARAGDHAAQFYVFPRAGLLRRRISRPHR
jgi:hypothetical protein